MMEERRLLHTLPPTMVVVEIRSCNSMCLPGPRFICHAIRLCHTTGRLSHGLAAIALYSHFVFQWVLCVQLQTCPCCPVPSMLLERLMLLSRAISDLHHQLKRYNTICPLSISCLYTSTHFIFHMLALQLVLLIHLLLNIIRRVLCYCLWVPLPCTCVLAMIIVE